MSTEIMPIQPHPCIFGGFIQKSQAIYSKTAQSFLSIFS